jgi:hypothetical protein
MTNRALYTTLCAAVTLLAIAAGTLGAAQRTRRARPESGGPRALAVIEFPADEKAQPRLIPVSLLDEGRMWDAAVYRATPAPMALEHGVVYEAEKTGVPQGFFTVQAARPVQNRWIGRGRWEPRTEKPPAEPSAPAAPERDPDAPPLLRKPRPDGPPKPSAPEPPALGASASRSEPDDPDRPVLRRNPGGKKADTPIAADETVAFAAARRLAAISDAEAEPSRPYEFKWSADEERRVSQAMQQLAIQALRPHAGGLLKGRPPALTDTQFFPFDLEYDNYGDIVMTARWQRPAQGSDTPRDHFVTLVATLDIESKPRLIFSHVTDARRLDAQPRLELVDAVDADGDGKGELLFRAVGDSTYSYVLYRVFPQNLVRLTETAEFPLAR